MPTTPTQNNMFITGAAPARPIANTRAATKRADAAPATQIGTVKFPVVAIISSISGPSRVQGPKPKRPLLDSTGFPQYAATTQPMATDNRCTTLALHSLSWYATASRVPPRWNEGHWLDLAAAREVATLTAPSA